MDHLGFVDVTETAMDVTAGVARDAPCTVILVKQQLPFHALAAAPAAVAPPPEISAAQIAGTRKPG